MKKLNKKILFFDHDPAMSGSSISMKYIIEEFMQQGSDIYLLTQKQKEYARIFANLGVKIISNSGSKFKSIALSIHFADDYRFLTGNWFITFFKNVIRIFIGSYTAWKTILSVRPDMVYLNEHNMFYCAIVAKFFNIKSFIHLRSNFIRGNRGIPERIIAKCIYHFNEHIFAITDIEAKQILKYNMDPEGKVQVLPEFLSEENFKCNYSFEESRRDFSLPLDKTVVVSFVGIDRLKGTLDYLRSIDIVTKKQSDILFVLAGDMKKTGAIKEVSDYYQQCIDFLSANNLNQYLKIIGFTDKQRELLFASDILVSPFTTSHFSRPIIEAWALKKAIITSDNPHSRSYVREGVDGLYFKSAEELAGDIIRLANDRELSGRIAENGFEKARMNFLASSSLPKMIEKINMTFS